MLCDYSPTNIQTIATNKLAIQTIEARNNQSPPVMMLKPRPNGPLSFRARNAFSIAAAFCLTCMAPHALAHTCQASPVITRQQIGNLSQRHATQ
jgi:hypothetical protein